MTSLTSLSAAAAGSLLSAIWQGILLVACVAVCLRLLPGISAATRSIIWTAVLLLAVLLHLTPFFGLHRAAETHATLHADPRWSVALAGVWGVLTLYRIGQLLASALRLRQIARRALPVSFTVDSTREAQLCTSTDVDRPSVVGFFSPRILLPPDLLASLTPQELDQVLLHETEHLRRRDDWTNLLQKLALAAFPLNPALLWVERRLCLERELACDDRVLVQTRARKAYALCLTNLAEHGLLRRTANLALGAWERQSELARRVRRILANPEALMGRTQARVVTTALILSVAGGTVALTRAPELVTFTPAAAISQAQIPSTEFTASPYREDGPKPVLVKAMMPGPQRTSPAISKPARRRAVRTAKQSGQPRGATHKQKPSWIMLTEWHETALPMVRLAIAGDQEKFSYAAVPTTAGWLIVQL